MSIIAVESSNQDLAGAITYWRGLADAPANAFNETLDEHGLAEHHISMPSVRAAMHRALSDFTGPTRFVRVGRGGDRNVYLVDQEKGDSGKPEFVVHIRAEIGARGLPEFFEVDDAGEEFVSATCSRIDKRFWDYFTNVQPSDISGWLIQQARLCDAVPLRPAGGVYFVPRAQLDLWRRRVDALAKMDCAVDLIPALKTDEAVNAIMEAFINECTSFTETLTTELTEGNLGEVALQNRGEAANALLEKLARYEELLGIRLEQMREQITEQQTNAIAAALSAQAKQEAAK